MALACIAMVVGSLSVVGVAGRRILLPGWRGSAAVTGGMAIVLLSTVTLGQVLGALGLLNRWAAVVASAAVAAAALLALRRWPTRGEITSNADPDPGPEASAASTAFATFAILVVLGFWLVRTVVALRRGMTDPDSVGYHLPLTHVFASTGVADPNRLPHAYLPIYTYPGNDELVSAFALAVSQSVVFSTVKNLILAIGSLVAAHAIGAKARASVPAMVSVAVVLGLPIAAFTVPGHAKNDALVVFAVLVGLACLLLAGEKAAPLVLAGGCGGVVIGTKLSSVVAGGVLVLWTLVAAYRRGRPRRWRTMTLVVLASLAAGVPWYVRNLLTFGNPVPLARLSIGALSLPSVPSVELERTKSIASFLLRRQYHSATFFEGLVGAVGPVGLLVVLAGAAGLVVGLRSGGWRRGTAAFGLLLTVAYLTTPATAYSDLEGRPIAYGVTINVHYALPAAAVCLLVLAVSLPIRLTSWALPVLAVGVTLAGLPVGREFAFWFTDIGGAGFGVLVLAAAAAAVAVGLKRSGQAGWRRATAVAAILTPISLASIVGSQPDQRTEDPVARYLAAAPRTRIAANVGYLGTLYGPGGRHDVTILSQVVDRVPLPYVTCGSFMAAVTSLQSDLVAVNIAGEAYDWAATDPALRLEAAGPRSQLYSVIGLPGSRCPPTP